MRFLGGLFKKKERKTLNLTTEETKPTELEIVCSDSPDVFEALKEFMFLNPTMIDISLKDAVSKAKEFEKAKDKLRAAVWYRIAGGLAIYKGDAVKVKEFFGKYSELTGRPARIVEVAEEAVRRAREYYAKYLKG